MRFVCESCRAQYMINDEKVGPKGVKVRCRKCGYVILVKRADAAKGGGPVSMSNDPDDALATQVMQTPLAAAEATLSNEDATSAGEEMTNPGVATSGPTLTNVKAESPRDSFFGADEDEIGAVFDQVLKTGNNSSREGTADSASSDDRQSTRVIDADTVRKLAEESGAKDRAPEPKAEEIPLTDWYVAINEKQTGPLTLEKIKEHWDHGEISPDSLCWRAGFDDWIPVSEAKMLNSVLAPKPPKPIVVAPAATITQSAPAVVSVPVQSAFSAGGMMQTVQSEMQVPMSAVGAGSMADREDTGGWKPSAASALASLVKDEMDALAKPAPKAPPAPVVEEAPQRGLLDLPQEEKPTNAAVVQPMPVEERHARPAAQAPVNPYLQNPGATYSAPAVTQYRPPNNRGLMLGLAGGGAVVLLVLVGLIVWLATRQQNGQQPQQPVAMVVPPPTPTPTPVVVPPTPTPTPTPVAVTPTPTPEATPTTPVVTPTPTATPAPVVAQPVAPVQPKSNPNPGPATPRQPKTVVARAETPEPTPTPTPKKASSGGDDDFDNAFGGSGSKSTPKEEAPRPEKKQAGYIPPAPGGSSEVKQSLGPSDIMEVVLANKGLLGKCVEEQRKKDPGTSGKLLMKWTIQTSGKTSNVAVASDEFKGTPIATCVGNLIKSMTFPKHKQQGEPITFPFKF